ncbi:MAG: hypothetical protein ACE5JU_02695 [Candidatus Binatia bacterium]
MDFQLPKETQVLKDTMRRFVDHEMAPIEMQRREGKGCGPLYCPEGEATERS